MRNFWATTGIRLRQCQHIQPGKAYVLAKPTEAERHAYRLDAAVHGKEEAQKRLAWKLALRGLVIHNIGGLAADLAAAAKEAEDGKA